MVVRSWKIQFYAKTNRQPRPGHSTLGFDVGYVKKKNYRME